MLRLIHLTSLAVGIFALVGNLLFGLYITALKLSSHRLTPLLVSITLLLVWGSISLLAYFLVGIATFSNSDQLLERLTPSFIIGIYVLLGLVIFLGFQNC